jgi:hypothetical protein
MTRKPDWSFYLAGFALVMSIFVFLSNFLMWQTLPSSKHPVEIYRGNPL